MADNVELNAGAGGATLATDDIAGTHHQRVKIQHGEDGSATDVSSASPLPIGDAGGSLTVDNAHLTALGGAISGTEVQVDVVTSALPSGAATSAKQDTVIGHLDGVEGLLTTIDADTGTIAGAVSGLEMQVDVVTSALPTGAATSAKQDTVIGHLDGVEGLLTTIDGDTGVLAAAVAGTEMQVDVVGALPAGTNAIGKLAANSGVDIGDVDVTSIAAGSNLIGNVGIGVRTSGGVTPFKSLDLDESEEEVKGSAGQVYFIHAMNLAASKRYLKFYNDTAANVTVGTTTPVLTFVLGTQGDTNGAGFTLAIPQGIAFSAAITIAATTGFADNDTGAPGANEVIVNIGYN